MRIGLKWVPDASLKDIGDCVSTPAWAARDIVDFFKPSGRILEPCKGNGVFLQFLPTAEWCEIKEGRDFFKWKEKVDWIITNPPYSVFAKFLRHSMQLADNIILLVPLAKPFYSFGLLKKTFEWGGIKHIRIYGGGAKLSFPVGYAIGAVHFAKNYRESIGVSLYELSRHRVMEQTILPIEVVSQ